MAAAGWEGTWGAEALTHLEVEGQIRPRMRDGTRCPSPRIDPSTPPVLARSQSLVLWTSAINCWLQEEKACGAAGAKAAVEELELNQQVESRILVVQQPAPSTASPPCSSLGRCCLHQTLIAELLRGQAPAVSVVETGPIATGIGLIDLIAVRDGRDAMAGAARPKSARGASAESRRSTAGGVETVGQRMSPCVAWPA